MSPFSHITPHFLKNEQENRNFHDLRNRVKHTIESLPKTRHRWAILKAFLLPALYLSIYVAALFTRHWLYFLGLYAMLGIMVVIMFLNLVHEVCHNTLFSNKKYNSAYMLLFDMIGANSYIWKIRHVRLHHPFTNVIGWDSDIEKSKFLKVHPEDRKKLLNRYQHFLLLLYPLFITNWFLVRDFKDYFSKKTIARKLGSIPAVEYVKLFFFKSFFTGYLVVIPALFSPFTWLQVLLALFIMLFTAGLFALTVLLPPHVNTSNQFPVASEQCELKQSWLMHQLNTTNDVNGYNWFSRHVMANYNFHIAHHLFPNVSYVYAKEVTDTIRDFCTEKGLPYRSYALSETFINHYRLIRRNSRVPNILEEDM